MRAHDGAVAVRVVADRQSAHTRSADPAVPVEGGDEFAVRLDGDDQVRRLAGQFAGLRAGDGDPDPWRLRGQVPQLGRLHVEVRPVVIDAAAAEECADDLHRLGQHLLPYVGSRPTTADDTCLIGVEVR